MAFVALASNSLQQKRQSVCKVKLRLQNCTIRREDPANETEKYRIASSLIPATSQRVAPLNTNQKIYQ